MYHAVHRGQPEARLLVLGDGPLRQVFVKSSGLSFSLGPERQRQAELACERLRERGQVVTADPVYRVLSWEVGDGFELLAELADYSQVVGAKSHPEWGIKAQVVAVCCVLECPQGFVIEKRSQQVAAAPGKWHIVPSGSLQPPSGPWQTVIDEAREELGLEPSEIADVRCVGMLYGEDSGVYQLACSARTEVSFDQMLARPRSGAWEQDGFECAPTTPVELPAWLAKHASRITPGGRAALWAEGRRRWGQGWFDDQCQDEP